MKLLEDLTREQAIDVAERMMRLTADLLVAADPKTMPPSTALIVAKRGLNDCVRAAKADRPRPVGMRARLRLVVSR